MIDAKKSLKKLYILMEETNDQKKLLYIQLANNISEAIKQDEVDDELVNN